MPRHGRILAGLLVAYLAVWAALAIDPVDRFIWTTENALVFVGLPIVVLTRRRFAFSLASYVAMAVFLTLHAVGAHYGYTNVPLPWREWGFERNNTDRVMHFLFGVLAALPLEEILRRIARIRRGWLEAMVVTCTFALAAAFEIVEMLAVFVGGDAVGPQTGGYLGTQGDDFDAVKDMALGLVGALVTVATLLAFDAAKRKRSDAPQTR